MLVRRVLPVITLASVGLVLVWLYRQRHELAGVDWEHQWLIILIALLMYGISAVLNFIIWHLQISRLTSISWRNDLYLFAYSSLSRRLPSGLGYLLVRTVRYPAEGAAPGAVVYLSIKELFFQVLAGIGASLLLLPLAPPAARSTYLVMLVCAVLLVSVGRAPLLARFLSRLGAQDSAMTVGHMFEGPAWLWLTLYLVTWLNGGVMLYLLIAGLGYGGVVGLWQATVLWTLSGTLGLVAGVVPLGQFARDAALSVLLAALVPPPAAITIALLFRLILTLGDVLWSFILMGIAKLTRKRYCETGSHLV